MSQGLFELRKDAITSWWVATIIDRTFARERFALPASRIDDHGDCFNCRIPPGDGVRLRVLKDFAFTVAGTEEEARARDQHVAQLALADARAAGSWRTVVAPPGEHRALHAVGSQEIEAVLARCRDEIVISRGAGRTQHLQVVQNWGAQAGARTNHLCFDLYDLPQIPHRIAEELGGAARFMIREGECPFCRLVREEVRRPDRLLFADDAQRGLRAVRKSLPVRDLGGPTAPRQRLRPCIRLLTSRRPPRRSATSSASSPPALTGRPTTWSCTAARSGNRSMLRTIGTGKSTHGCARLQVSSWEPGCP